MTFDPDYLAVIKARSSRLAWLRQNPDAVPGLCLHYKHHIADFINDWGVTFDPRNAGTGKPQALPFILFPKQREWVDFVIDHWQRQRDCLTEKSRDMGVSWLAMSMSASICMFWEGVTVGVGSRLEEDVDKIGDPDSLFWKARYFAENVPPEFHPGWEPKKNSPYMRLTFPHTGSAIIGGAGDNIGRGGRSSLFLVDESAHLTRPKLVDAALSATTNCRVDLSSVNGMGNSFAEKRHRMPPEDVFTFHWRSDPRKDDAWYALQCERLDPVIVAQEIDINYAASVEGVLIPSAWVQAAVDAHLKLSIAPSGSREGALDVADEGKDYNAFIGAHGILIEHVEEWRGVGSDIAETTARAFGICDDRNYDRFKFDEDGLGAGVRGDARVMNEMRRHSDRRQIEVLPFRGSAGVWKPDSPIDPRNPKGRTNKDYYKNRKAQGWFQLRRLFMNTYQAIVQNKPYDPDDIISISSKIPLLAKLQGELSQVTYGLDTQGKILVNKMPDGIKSPNLADGVMIRYAEAYTRPMNISDAARKRWARR